MAISIENPNPKLVAKRFVLPVLAAWLINTGTWMIVFAASQPILSGLLNISNWYAEHFGSGDLQEESWNFPLITREIAEGSIPIMLGLLLGFWVLHRKRQKSKAPAPSGG
jgi:hypothetical protein